MAGQRRPPRPRKYHPPQTDEEARQELKELVDILAEGKVDAETYKQKYYRALGIIMGETRDGIQRN